MGDTCDQDVAVDVCTFGTSQCVCDETGSWSCTDCPASAPNDGDTCEVSSSGGDFADACVFADTTCACFDLMGDGNTTWNCF